jgi:hypothetical protein
MRPPHKGGAGQSRNVEHHALVLGSRRGVLAKECDRLRYHLIGCLFHQPVAGALDDDAFGVGSDQAPLLDEKRTAAFSPDSTSIGNFVFANSPKFAASRSKDLKTSNPAAM